VTILELAVSLFLRVSVFLFLISVQNTYELNSLLLIMKLLNLLTMAGLATACAHDHDDKEWTKEELDELEQKWGYEVCSGLSLESPLSIL
jgi:hypothetical protein